ncbi:MAG: histidinol-phosphate transaminase [Propionibacteriaceae bacterium]|jgi:histidinol-phosphate aminotransferase|nr:histidinol-phosphate transaminase [Propionibacteriaceae bacterium]
MPVHYRRQLDAIASYRPGPPPPQRDYPTYKLSSNENPFPPLPSVRQAIADHLGGINRYPQADAAELVSALAERAGVTTDEVVVGAGSVEVISAVVRAVAGAQDEIVFAWRSFEAYPQLVVAAGATPKPVPLTAAWGHDLAAMARAVTAATRCVLVCNPNNPTGTVVTAAALDDFLDQVPDDVTVVLDEAYRHFDRDRDSPDGLDCYRRHPNVVVCHTFSKAYGLAGLRVGQAVMSAALAEQARKVLIPFGVTDLAQQAALASLAAEAELDQRVDQLVARRRQVEAALAAQGWELPASQGNFVWLPTGAVTATATAILDRHGLAGRPFAGEGVRLSVGETESVDQLIAAAAEIRQRLDD